MSEEPDLHDLVAAFDLHAVWKALKEAYRRGEEAERARVLKAIGAVPISSKVINGDTAAAAPAPAVGAAAMISDDEDDGAKRAPRGLTREVVTKILDQDLNGLTMADIQDRAVRMDNRLSAKTVYNELNREKGKLYVVAAGRWFLMPPSGASQVRPQPETESAERWRGLLPERINAV
ncbi:MAG: hypothetical protein JSR98_21450 [Proteobacteria bacterium]|nr:hypothetical protein [Pseudomonadota bacterium]